jgi:hypothetical protein
MIMNDGQIRIWEQTIVVYLKVGLLSRQSFEETLNKRQKSLTAVITFLNGLANPLNKTKICIIIIIIIISYFCYEKCIFVSEFLIVSQITQPVCSLCYGLDDRDSISGRGKRCFSWLPALQPTQIPIPWTPGCLSPGVKRKGREADH